MSLNINLGCQSYILITLFILIHHWAIGVESVTLAWDQNVESDVEGYKVYYGTNSNNYSMSLNVQGVSTTKATLNNLDENKTYYAVATAYNKSGLESNYSNEIMFTTTQRSYPYIDILPVISTTGDSFLKIQIYGVEGQTLTLESSLNLIEWFEFGTITINGDNNFLIDDNIKPPDTKFYRIKL